MKILSFSKVFILFTVVSLMFFYISNNIYYYLIPSFILVFSLISGAFLMRKSIFFQKLSTFTRSLSRDRTDKREIVLYVFLLLGTLFSLIFTLKMDSNNDWFSWIAMEGGFWESLEVLLFFLSFLILYRAAKKRTSLYPASSFKWVSLSFAFFCLFIALEEFNWGQHLFHFKTPSFFLSFNEDQEFNLHDLTLFGFQWVKVASFGLKFLIINYVCLLPLLTFIFWDLRAFCNAIGFPVPHLIFTPFIIFVVLIKDVRFSKKVLGFEVKDSAFSLSEVWEVMFAMIVLFSILLMINAWKKEKEKSCI